MIVPQYWAEARMRVSAKKRRVTVRRFGWSDVSQQEAQTNAELRAKEALDRILAGESLRRYEPKIPYNGAEGVPIREEIIARYHDSVITRNSYGAQCLNTPDVLFADVDLDGEPRMGMTCSFQIALLICALVYSWKTKSIGHAVLGLGAAAILGYVLALACHKIRDVVSGGAERRARARINTFIKTHPDWNVRVYRTPAGFRVLATHRPFNPREQAVVDFFHHLGTDPIYARMCHNQNCFRARVSPKPWRIGINAHMRPRPGIWPVHPDRLPLRTQWIAEYERIASGFASCRFVEAIGSGTIHPKTADVLSIHDELSRANSQLAMA